jgi:hypothetical protein
MVYAAVAFFDSKRGFMVAYDDVSFHGGRLDVRCFDYIYDVFLGGLVLLWDCFSAGRRGRTNLTIEIA